MKRFKRFLCDFVLVFGIVILLVACFALTAKAEDNRTIINLSPEIQSQLTKLITPAVKKMAEAIKCDGQKTAVVIVTHEPVALEVRTFCVEVEREEKVLLLPTRNN